MPQERGGVDNQIETIHGEEGARGGNFFFEEAPDSQVSPLCVCACVYCARKCVCVRVCVHGCAHACVCVYVCEHVSMCACAHVRVCVCAHERV